MVDSFKVKSEKALFTKMKSEHGLLYQNAEWVLNHPRFGIIMLVLIGTSFLNYAWLAAILLVIFAIEISIRALVIRYKRQTYPYRDSSNNSMDMLFLFFDIIGALSLLVTIFSFALPLEDAAALRFIRALYLLRTLRLFRYIDIQSAIYSPTYGMVISVIVLLSFFVTDIVLWTVLMFFFVELIVRYVIMRNMLFTSRREKAIEWTFWWIDLVATVAMVPGVVSNQAGNILRTLRLIRLFRPWLVILKNLRLVIKEGQYLQEVNLIVLMLAFLSIAGGVGGHFLGGEYDYTRDGAITAKDHEMLSHIWFAFRSFSDPGNTVFYPETNEIALFSILAVVVGVFIFAFFIGIGANIVSGLMSRLRNEKMNIANHMVMLGWNRTSPFILHELRSLSQRSFSRLKLVLLNPDSKRPDGYHNEDWVSIRWGDMEIEEDIQRVNMVAAKQVIVNVPDHTDSEERAHSFFSLLAIRQENPDIYVSYALSGSIKPRLKKHHHPLQVGWDKNDFYNKPTVIHSLAEVRANLFRKVLLYPDYDQVITRLMIPPRVNESALCVTDWNGELLCEDDHYFLQHADGSCKVRIDKLVKALFNRGVLLIAAADSDMHIQSAMAPTASMQIFSLVGIALDANTLAGEINFTMQYFDSFSSQNEQSIITELSPLEIKRHIDILIIGNVGSLPLMLKRLLQSYDTLSVTVIDNLSRSKCNKQKRYLQRRLEEQDGANGRINLEMVSWNHIDMQDIEEHLVGIDRIILAPPLTQDDKPHALVAGLLSDMISFFEDHENKPMIFPVVDTREQALMLQKQMDKFHVEDEIHLMVPNEFYGTYVAHTSFHMFISRDKHVYEMHRSLRYVIDDMMSDAGDHSNLFTIDALKVDSPLPECSQGLFNGLFDQGYLWIGFRLKDRAVYTSEEHDLVFKMFPREFDFRCMRQQLIVMNHTSMPSSISTWEQNRQDIVELIVIRFDNHEDDDDIFF